MEYRSIPELMGGVREVLEFEPQGIRVRDADGFRTVALDRLVWTAVFAVDEGLRGAARWVVWEAGRALGTWPASVQGYYLAKGKGAFRHATVPACNLRGMTYDVARAGYRSARRHEVGAFICEIARSEIGYTRQRPGEYTTVVLGAAIREGVSGPIFVQGDHFQVKAAGYREDRLREMDAVRGLIREALACGFYNIDVDCSTLVDLSRPTLREQQRENVRAAAELTHFIRSHEPAGMTVSVGGEIGEVGGKNSTVEEFEAFMEGYLEELDTLRPGAAGLSKISVQTGTTHGGVPLPDGTVAPVKIDLKVLEDISRVARERFGLAGAVQHGASTLPESAFGSFPRHDACEVHLATAFQNIMYDGGRLPAEFRDRIHAWLASECAAERRAGDSERQFLYRTRKKGYGPFKREWWSLPEETRRAVAADLEERFDLLFETLNVVKSHEDIENSVTSVRVARPIPAPLAECL